MLVGTEDVLQIIGYAVLGFDDECKLGALLEELADSQASLVGYPDGVPRAAHPPGVAALIVAGTAGRTGRPYASAMSLPAATPAPGMTACVFCGKTNVKLTREHVIPKWARRSFDVKRPVTVDAARKDSTSAAGSARCRR